MSAHIPVMTREAVEYLRPGGGGLYLDCTVGLGGHARALLEAGAARVIGLDRDLDALAIARQTLSPYADRVVVVPNPYRGRAAWDLDPSATDPTGAHVDFLHMPRGRWTLRIFTIAGDLVAEIKESDRRVDGRPQQESPDDGQASWNLLSRNGQEVVSGIYLFSVTSDEGSQRGSFVIIR